MNIKELTPPLPKNWDFVPLKSVATYEVSNVDKHSHENEEFVRLCNYTDVYKNERITLDMDLMRATATRDEISKFHLEVDDVVITKDSESWNDIAVPALISETSDDLVCGYHLAVLRANPQILSGRYLFRAVQSRPVATQLELASTGVTRFGLPKGAIGSALIPVPPLPEQRRIADYLDRETTRIDELVAAKESMLRLLEEKRSALISRAVTRGLDPKAPTKPSGLDWLGEIPAHWELRRLKQLSTRIDTGGTPSAKFLENSEEGEFPWFTPGDFSFEEGLSDSKRKIPEAAIHEGEAKAFPADALLIVGIGATLGKAALSKCRCSANQQINVIFGWKDAIPEFMLASIRSNESILKAHSNSATLPILNQERLGVIQIPVPPLEEQRTIIAHLQAHQQRNAELESTLRNSIALLKERRSALITAAVTGKIPLVEMSA